VSSLTHAGTIALWCGRRKPGSERGKACKVSRWLSWSVALKGRNAPRAVRLSRFADEEA